jgi:hypothetical protein
MRSFPSSLADTKGLGLGGTRRRSLPKRLQNPVEVPTAVFDGLETVQESREASMRDHQVVRDIAIRLGYPETALWIQEHQEEYLEGLIQGFVNTE